MSLRTHPLSLTTSDQTVLTVPQGQEGTINNLLITGSGALTLKYHQAATNTTYTVFNGKTVTDQIALERSFNLAQGDQLIASDDGSGLQLFASVYYVGNDSGSAAMPYGPGPQELQAGDWQAGYFGEVSAAEFYTGDRLALELGVTEDIPRNVDAGWLKFAHNGRVLFIAKQPLMYVVTWDHLYARGIVYGTNDEGKHPRNTPTNQHTTIRHGGNQFIVRLMTGANTDPFPESDPLYGTSDMADLDIGGGSEWNDLMYRVHTDVPTSDGTDGMTADHHGGPQYGANWASFSDNELRTGPNVDGRRTWCQEMSDANSATRVTRGDGNIANFDRYSSHYQHAYQGWRPVLELIPNT